MSAVEVFMKCRAFKKSAIAAIVSSLLVSSVYAGVDAESSEPIERITVYGEKIERSLKDTTSSISVIDKETLDSGQYQSTSSALSEVPNVVVLSGSVPDIRGVSVMVRPPDLTLSPVGLVRGYQP